MKKKARPNRKDPRKKGSLKKKKTTAKKLVKKKARSSKRLGLTSSQWKVVCSIQGVIGRGLTRAEAAAQSKSHQSATGHRTTFTSSQ